MQSRIAAATTFGRLFRAQPGHVVAVVAHHRVAKLGVRRDREDDETWIAVPTNSARSDSAKPACAAFVAE